MSIPREVYGIWDDRHNDLILLPGQDGYCRSVYHDLKLLEFCLGVTDAKIVKLTVEEFDINKEEDHGTAIR